MVEENVFLHILPQESESFVPPPAEGKLTVEEAVAKVRALKAANASQLEVKAAVEQYIALLEEADGTQAPQATTESQQKVPGPEETKQTQPTNESMQAATEEAKAAEPQATEPKAPTSSSSSQLPQKTSSAILNTPPAHIALSAVLQFLQEQGYTQTLAALEKEAPKVAGVSQLIDPTNHLLTAMEALSAQRAAAQGVEERREKQRREEALATLTQSRDALITRCSATLSKIHSCNVLSLDFCHEADSSLLVSTGSDKALRITDFKEETSKATYTFPAPVVDVCWHPLNSDLIAAGCMNGGVFLVDQKELFPVQTAAHSKFVVRVKWSPDGKLLASASHDQTVGLFRVGDESKLVLVKQLEFTGGVESVAWAGSNSLIVGVRDDNFLHIIDVTTFQEKSKLNLNAHGDNHVSFTPMDITVSNDEKWLVVTTDKHRSIMYEIGYNDQVRNFYGAVNDNLSRARSVWSLGGSSIYGTSQDRAIVGWDVGSSKVQCRLEGHKEDVRALAAHPHLNLIGSAAFDKTVKLWAP